MSTEARASIRTMPRKWPSITLLLICEVAAMTVWFSSSAALPAILAETHLSPFRTALLTSSVQAGFVAGTLLSALTGLSDRFDPRKLFMSCCLVAATANASLLALPAGSDLIPALRFVTGMSMAGVYPVGMKIAATWAVGDAGLLIGLLVGALTLGSASPHLIAALGGVDWRLTYLASSLAALGAGALINLAAVGPNERRSARFDPRFITEIWHTKPLRLATFGYLGHMWELYAMWAWIGAFLLASFRAAHMEAADQAAEYGAFLVIGVGALSCVAAGLAADRWGRTTVTIAAMAVSGSCAALSGVVFGLSPGLVLTLGLVWGVSVIADSAQFSAAIVELSPADKIGTMLTLQTCFGFLLTLVTIHLVPDAVAALGWKYAFSLLSIGPALGIWAMVALRRSPAAEGLANGRR